MAIAVEGREGVIEQRAPQEQDEVVKRAENLAKREEAFVKREEDLRKREAAFVQREEDFVKRNETLMVRYNVGCPICCCSACNDACW